MTVVFPGAERLRKIKERFGDRVSVKWHPFALRPHYEATPFNLRTAMWSRPGVRHQPWPNRTVWNIPCGRTPNFRAGACLAWKPVRPPSVRAKTPSSAFNSGLFRAFFIENKSLIEKETCVEVAGGQAWM